MVLSNKQQNLAHRFPRTTRMWSSHKVTRGRESFHVQLFTLARVGGRTDALGTAGGAPADAGEGFLKATAYGTRQ